MKREKTRGDAWSLTDVVNASGRSRNSVNVLARLLLPAELLEKRAGRGAAVQLPEDVALALVAALRIGLLDPGVITEMKKDPAAALEAADGLAKLARLVATPAEGQAA